MKSEIYSVFPAAYPSVLEKCINVAILLAPVDDNHIIDIRMWLQKRETEDCFILYPTVVIKFSANHRYVFHDGLFAYELIGKTSVKYYDAVRARHLPLLAALKYLTWSMDRNKMVTYIFPVIQILICLGAASIYGYNGNIRKCVYWLAAAILTVTVTF